MSRKRKCWSDGQVQILKRMAKRKRPAPAIGKRLRRTSVAIRQKAFALGLSLETRQGVLSA